VVQVVEPMLCGCKALSSNQVPSRKRKKYQTILWQSLWCVHSRIFIQMRSYTRLLCLASSTYHDVLKFNRFVAHVHISFLLWLNNTQFHVCARTYLYIHLCINTFGFFASFAYCKLRCFGHVSTYTCLHNCS
jgi:hypothetical protein